MAEDEPNGDPTSPQDARLSSLNERLKQAEKVEAERAPDQIDASTVVKNVGQRVAQSLIGMPLGGAIIGWLLDRLFDTAPWIMLALMFIGFAGAVLDVMRYSRQGPGKDSGK
jgi:ATP synthase protein I